MSACAKCGRPAKPTWINGMLYIRCPTHLAPLLAAAAIDKARTQAAEEPVKPKGGEQ